MRFSGLDGELALSPLRPDDAEAHFAGEDPELIRWLNGGPGTLAGTREYFRHCQEEWASGGSLRAFGIRVNGVLAGTVDLRFSGEHLAPGEANVAYGLYPVWRGRGFATRAVLLAVRYAAGEGARRAVIMVEPENANSSAVARRAGFELSGQVTEDGEVFDRYFLDLR
ncbi:MULTISPECIES: GNAT family N-acetyltransferase [Amycolatopsis]|uniref:GNAT family N-acetyltransferase n=1 Tax=Amycolatopsis albidoflavus TaxID=102226 RepID=A0ABW5I4Q7_9PSEU